MSKRHDDPENERKAWHIYIVLSKINCYWWGKLFFVKAYTGHSYGYIPRYAVMSDILIGKVFNKIHSIIWCANEHWHHISLSLHFAEFVKFTFWKVSGQSFNLPTHILVYFETLRYMYSTVLYGRNAWNCAIHLFFLCFTDILAYLDMQTELQDCLYE